MYVNVDVTVTQGLTYTPDGFCVNVDVTLGWWENSPHRSRPGERPMARSESIRTETTLHDVAARVGVSTRTVSRVVNREGGFSNATEAKVRAAIDELGYRPNLLARGLITRQTKTIGLIGGSMLDPFFPELAEGVQQAGQALGLTMFFASSNDDFERQARSVESLVSRAVDGIIIFPVRGELEPLRWAIDSGVNLVAVNPRHNDPSVSSISSDITAGARLAVEHLKQRGRTRIAYLGNKSPSSSQREQGFRDSIGPNAEPIIHKVNPTAEDAVRGALTLVERWPDIDSLFTYNDVMAMGAMRALASTNRSIPGDVAVVGFDNIGLSAHVNPSLTTIDLHQATVGRTAVGMLRDIIDSPEGPTRQVVQPVQLVVRESTGIASGIRPAHESSRNKIAAGQSGTETG